MENFLTVSFSFPTIIFTVLLIFISVYWLLTIFGLFDIDFLNLDIDFDYSGEAPPVGGLAGVMVALGLTGLPVSIIISFLILFSWLGVYLSSLYVLVYFDKGYLFWLIASVFIILSIIVSIPITIALTKPMRRFFTVDYATKSNDLLGEICQVISSEVSDKYGEAELNNAGDHFVFQVRDKNDNSIKKGDNIILLEYDSENHWYYVKKY
jgi:hypothetical protein